MIMEIFTTRFGQVEVQTEDVLHFPGGLPGLEQCCQWVLVAEAENDQAAWLQSIDRADVALAVVSPRRFVPDFQLRVARREIEPLKLDEIRAARVLVIVGRTERSLTLNLKAPIVINLRLRLARQVIANGDLPVQHELGIPPSAMRKSA
jgi:flagellar assembly factor FliW